MHTTLVQLAMAIEKLKLVEKILSEFGIVADEECIAQLENNEGLCIAHSAEKNGYSLNWGVGFASPEDANDTEYCVTLFINLLDPNDVEELDITYFVDDDAWQGEGLSDFFKKYTPGNDLSLDKILEQDFDDRQAVQIITLLARVFTNPQQHPANLSSHALN